MILYFYIFIFLFGLIIGSFFNALIFRMRKGQSIWRGRSQCPRCQKTLRWFELIPILSFIIQKGRCRGCQKKIDWQYPLVELTAGILFLFGLCQYPISNIQYSFINLLVYWFIVSILLVIFVYDLRYGEIPDEVTLPAITLLLVFWLANYFIFQVSSFRFQVSGYEIWNLLIAIAISGGFFALQYFISRGRWIGAGDIRLGILMGLILGQPKILVALFFAYVGGAVISLVLLLFKKKTLKSAVPFGVFLVPATLAALWWGEGVVRWYFGLFR